MPISKTSISWPPELKEEVRTLIQLLFSLLDSRDPHIGKRLAQDVFTQDGRFYSSTGYYQGQGTLRDGNIMAEYQITNLACIKQISRYHELLHGKTSKFAATSSGRYTPTVPTA